MGVDRPERSVKRARGRHPNDSSDRDYTPDIANPVPWRRPNPRRPRHSHRGYINPVDDEVLKDHSDDRLLHSNSHPTARSIIHPQNHNQRRRSTPQRHAAGKIGQILNHTDEQLEADDEDEDDVLERNGSHNAAVHGDNEDDIEEEEEEGVDVGDDEDDQGRTRSSQRFHDDADDEDDHALGTGTYNKKAAGLSDANFPRPDQTPPRAVELTENSVDFAEYASQLSVKRLAANPESVAKHSTTDDASRDGGGLENDGDGEDEEEPNEGGGDMDLEIDREVSIDLAGKTSSRNVVTAATTAAAAAEVAQSLGDAEDLAQRTPLEFSQPDDSKDLSVAQNSDVDLAGDSTAGTGHDGVGGADGDRGADGDGDNCDNGDDDDDDDEGDLVHRSRRKEKGKRIDSDEDPNAEAGDETQDADEANDAEFDPGEVDDEQDDNDADFGAPSRRKGDRSLTVRVCMNSGAGAAYSANSDGTPLQSGRISKKPKSEFLEMEPRPSRRASRSRARHPVTRDAKRRHEEGNGVGFEVPGDDVDDEDIENGTRRSKRRRVTRTSLAESEDEFECGVPRRGRSGSKSRLRDEGREDQNAQYRGTRSGLRSRTTGVRNRTVPEQNRYPTRGRVKMSGAGKTGRPTRNGELDGKDSEEEVEEKDDVEYHVSSAQESDEVLDEGAGQSEHAGVGENETPDESEDTPQSRILRSNKRKKRPSVTEKRARRDRKAKKTNSLAENAANSYNPRPGKLHRKDFYPGDEATSESSASSGDDGAARRPMRTRSVRKAADRANVAIANEMNNIDFVQNPMGLVDSGKSSRSKRADRYGRHRGRLRPSGPDPFASEDDSHGPGAGATPIEPMQVDPNLSWDDIGGLEHHVRALKEMVFLPLMYPEVFEKFSMEAPKGVLFYGPPGTGKTLCARALAASCGAEVESVPAPTVSNSVAKSEYDCLPGASANAKAQLSQGNENGSVEKARANELSSSHAVVGKHSAPASTENYAADGTVTGSEPKAGQLKENASVGAPGQRFAGGKENEEVDAEAAKVVKKKPRVAFFMRNGADCLSKWVGEAERQLRMTFEAAKKHQPAIIFFDEIDGLAPVRSSRQDQIHSSIVSTLLGLMDGLDSRGKIVVIGATNRVDAIDPALRRPGRFDREMIFTLPNMTARRKILDIHTTKWSPPPKPHMLEAISKLTVGYCGADLKALCSESAIRALRRRYPQIYKSNDKLLIDVDQVRVSSKDFISAMSDVVPASHRSARTHARPLPERLSIVLRDALQTAMSHLTRIFPQGLTRERVEQAAIGKSPSLTNLIDGNAPSLHNGLDDISSSDDDEDLNVQAMQNRISNAGLVRSNASELAMSKHQALRPRLLICGVQGLGQAQLGPALLHWCEGCPVHAIDYPSLHADMGARSAEEALISAFREAARSVPSVLYLPHMQLWWESAPQSLRTTMIIALKDLPSDLPLLVLATAEEGLDALPAEVLELFGEVQELGALSENVRREMFEPILFQASSRPKMSDAAAKRRRRKRQLEVLPKAPPPPPKAISPDEVSKKEQSENKFIRILRMEMRNFVEELLRDRRFKAFWNPVDPKSAPDYYDIIKIPMDFQSIAANIDSGSYPTVLSMVNDFDILVRNAIQYNPPNTEVGAAILRRAHGLIDIVHAWVDNLNPALVETCNKIITERVARGGSGSSGGNAALGNDEAEAEGEAAAVAGSSPSVPRGVGASETAGKDGNLMEKDLVANEGQGNAVALAGMDVDAIGDEAAGVNVKHVVEGNDETQIVEAGGEESTMEKVELEEVEEEEEEEEEEFTEARKEDIVELTELVVDVSTGMTVDGLEGLFVRCEKVLYENRRNMRRDHVVRLLKKTVTSARDDVNLVGKLVE